MIAWFIRNPVAANLLMLVLVGGGLLLLHLRVTSEVFPTIEPRTITIDVYQRGAAPSDMEQLVAIPIEEAIFALPGIEELYSVATESSAQIVVSIDRWENPERLLREVKNRIDALNTLPPASEPPVIKLSIWRREILTMALSSVHDASELGDYTLQVQAALQNLPAVTFVEWIDEPLHEWRLQADEQRLRAYGVTLAEIADAIRAEASTQTIGTVQTDSSEILLRSEGQRYSAEDFAAVVVRADPAGGVLRVGDLVGITQGVGDNEVITRFNGRKANLLRIYGDNRVSPITVAATVRDWVEERRAVLPEGYSVAIWNDRSVVLEKRLETLIHNAVQGGILVLALLALFLRPAIAFWVFLGIPVSFMGAFYLMPLLGVSLNLITLFGFIVVLGIVVDDAIVTGENIHRHLQMGKPPQQAALDGAREVAVPVTFGVLTTMVAFLPIAFVEGYRGQLFFQIVVVVLPVFAFSLIESKLILPAHLRHLSPVSPGRNRLYAWQQKCASTLEEGIVRFYRPLLVSVIAHRYTFLLACAGSLMLILVLFSEGWIRFVFFPRVESELATATVVLPAGSTLERTDVAVERLLDAARSLQDTYRDPESGKPVIRNIVATTGSARRTRASSVGSVIFEMEPPETRSSGISGAVLLREWRQRTGAIPGVESLDFQAEVGRASDPIEIQLHGESYEELRELGEALKSHLSRLSGVFDIADSLEASRPALDLVLRPEGRALGLSRADLAMQVASGRLGIDVQRIQRGRTEWRVLLRLKQSGDHLHRLEQQLIRTPTGLEVPLGQVAELRSTDSPVSLLRYDRKRTVVVTADIDKQQVNMLLLERDVSAFLAQALVRYPGVEFEWQGEQEEQARSFSSLGFGLLFVIFTMYVLLAIPLRSYSQPVLVMAVIPFGAIGALLGHWIMGMSVTLLSLLGLLALTGVVVNDSLVLTDAVNRQRRAGRSLHEAITEAGVLRFRPVLLTSLTTFFGLVPLLFERSTQAQFLIPMAVSLGFGILFATLLTLLLVPVNYLVLEDLRRWTGLCTQPERGKLV